MRAPALRRTAPKSERTVRCSGPRATRVPVRCRAMARLRRRHPDPAAEPAAALPPDAAPPDAAPPDAAPPDAAPPDAAPAPAEQFRADPLDGAHHLVVVILDSLRHDSAEVAG